MTMNTSDLKDGHLPLVERIDEALRRVKMGLGPMRVPVEATDIDIVLYNCRDRITELETKLAEAQKHLAGTMAITEGAQNRRRDEIVANEKLCAQLDKCESALRLALAGTEQHYFGSPARIDDVRAALADARAQIAAKDKRIAELERLFALNPIKVGDISITLGVNETGEWRMTFDGADDAKLAVVAGMFSVAMQAVIGSAEEVPNA